MSVFSIWEMRFPPEHHGEGRELACAIWSDMRSRFAGYLDHEIVADLDDPGHVIVVSRWESREAADAAMAYASHPNARRAGELVSEPRRRTLGTRVDGTR
jgi:heme-degrading monooxygenase HmoA